MKKLIYTEENFITPEECQELIKLSKANPDEMPYGDESRGGNTCLLYTSPSPRDRTRSRMPSSA